MIARTETITGSNYGNLDIYREAGIEKKQWYVAMDERTSEECLALDEVIVPIDEEFAPGVDAPSLHPSCRCTILPIIE
jgi:SPP1 gp7 family putative phage head morphogenesis protein